MQGRRLQVAHWDAAASAPTKARALLARQQGSRGLFQNDCVARWAHVAEFRCLFCCCAFRDITWPKARPPRSGWGGGSPRVQLSCGLGQRMQKARWNVHVELNVRPYVRTAPHWSPRDDIGSPWTSQCPMGSNGSGPIQCLEPAWSMDEWPSVGRSRWFRNWFLHIPKREGSDPVWAERVRAPVRIAPAAMSGWTLGQGQSAKPLVVELKKPEQEEYCCCQKSTDCSQQPSLEGELGWRTKLRSSKMKWSSDSYVAFCNGSLTWLTGHSKIKVTCCWRVILLTTCNLIKVDMSKSCKTMLGMIWHVVLFRHLPGNASHQAGMIKGSGCWTSLKSFMRSCVCRRLLKFTPHIFSK